MLVKPNWEIFKAKFSENPQENFEWFCYLLFSKEYNQPYGTHRYKNQSGIETDPIEFNGEVIGWQSKFYEDTLSTHKKDLLGTLTKTKRDNPNITKIILYTNSEWAQGRDEKEPQAKIDTEKKADELNIELIWRTRSYFESPFVCQEQREVSRYFFESDTKWELTNNGFKDTLRYCYLKNFKTISLLDEKKKRVSDIFVNLAIIKEQKEEQKEQFINKGTFEEIYKPKELINISKKSLIYGKAGIGKTTLFKYIAYMWAKGELYTEFEYVVYIPLRKWNNTQLKEVIRSHYYSQYNEEIELNIKENSHKILFLFDGYDELKSDNRDGVHDVIRDNNLTYYIITIRPYGYQKSNFIVDEYFEMIGFIDEDVIKYIDKFFGKDREKAKGLKSYLQNNISIKQIGYIPLMLEMICSQWEQEEFNELLTMTKLYCQVIEDMLEKHSKNKEVYEWENREEIKELLGKIAFEALTKQTIIFDGKLIRDTIGKENLDFFKKSIINSGFLKSDRKDKSLLGNNFEFLHLTFQEYFSALYVSELEPKEQSEIIRDWKFYPHMQMFFVFLGGLIDNKNFFLQELENEAKDIIGFYNFLFTIDCLKEMKINDLNKKNIELFNNKLITWLKFLIIHNWYYETVLERLKGIKIFVLEENHAFLLEQIESDKVNSHIKKVINNYFSSIERKSTSKLSKNKINTSFSQPKINSILIEELKRYKKDIDNKKIDKMITIFNKEIYDDKEIFLLISFMKDKTIDSSIRDKIGYFLLNIKKNKYEIFHALLNFIKENNYKVNYRFQDDYWSKYNSLKTSIVKSLYLLKINDDKSILKLIEVIKNNDIYVHIRIDLVETLFSLGRNDDFFIKFLLEIINDINISNKIKKSIIEFLPSLKRYDDEFIDSLVKIINMESKYSKLADKHYLIIGKEAYLINDEKDFNIINRGNYWVKYHIIESLCSFNKANQKIMNTLIYLIEDKAIPITIREKVIILLASLKIKDNEIVNILISFLKEKISNKSKNYIVKSLSDLRIENDEILKVILDFIKYKNNYKSKNNIIISLLFWKRKDKKFVNSLISLINDKNIDLKIKKKLIKFLGRIKFENNYVVMQQLDIKNNLTDLKRIFIRYSFSENFFKAIDANYLVLNSSTDIDMLRKNIVYNKLPLYIKNNKLYTIENGKEISTQREVDEAILNDIKMLLKWEGLDD